MTVDEGSGRPLHRLRCVYGLEAAALPAPGEGRFFGEAFDLGRFRAHFVAGRDHCPGVVADVALGPGDVTLPDPVGAVASSLGEGRLLVVACPGSGYVAVLEVDCSASLADLPILTAATCFDRAELLIRGLRLEDALADMSALARSIQLRLGRDVHQLWTLSEQAATQTVSEGADGPAFDLGPLLSVVYRSSAAQRPAYSAVKFPRELNRVTGSLACHARGVTVTARLPEHTEHAMVLIAAQLVAAAGRLRGIRTATALSLRAVRDPRWQRLAIDEQRRRFAELATTATNLEVDLSSGVEAYLDAVLIPEIVLEAYRDSLSESLGLPAGLAATSNMLGRLISALESTEQRVSSRVKERDELRAARSSATLGYLSLVAIPLGLLFAYFAIPERAQSHTSLLRLSHYGGIYSLIAGAVILGGLCVYTGVLLRQRRHQVDPSPLVTHTRISAHRAAAGHRPPTLADFAAAARLEVELVELDVRRTADGVMVATHDATLSDGRLISAVTFTELHGLLGAACVTMRDALHALAGHAAAHVDLKEVGYEVELVQECIAALGPNGFVVTSLEDESVRRIKDAFPQVRVALSLGRDMSGAPLRALLRTRWSEARPRRRLRACGADAVAMHQTLARLGVQSMASRMGLEVMVWTVNETKGISRCLRSPYVDVLVTDLPELALRERAGLAQAAGSAWPRNWVR